MHRSLARTAALGLGALVVLGGAAGTVGTASPQPEVRDPSPRPDHEPPPVPGPSPRPDPSPSPSPVRAAPTSSEGWLVAPGSSPAVGGGALRRFTVEVEPATGLSPTAVGRRVEAILLDPRSWNGTGRFRFQRTDDPAAADVRVVVATPATVDRWCARVGLHTAGWLSCQVHDRAMLNLDRWRHGVASFGADTDGYRAYLVNHEVGHVLGYRHVGCPGARRLAPVMMQQSKSVGACRPNGWVEPRAHSP